MREMNVSRYTMTTRPRKRVLRMLRPRRMRTRPRLGRDNDQHVRVTFPSGDTEIQSRTDPPWDALSASHCCTFPLQPR